MENYEYGTGENTDTVTTKAWAGEENTNIKKEKKKTKKRKTKEKRRFNRFKRSGDRSKKRKK